MTIRAIVFDLDDTLLDTTRLLIPIAKTPAFEARIREPLPLMSGAIENLEVLKKKYTLYLLTQGRPDAQMQKVRSLGIEGYFKKLFFADPSKNESKYDYFKKLIHEEGLPSTSILSIGNRRSTDIRDAKRCGAFTCLFHYGEHNDELPTQKEDNPDFTVTNHRELIATCRL